MGRRRAYGQCHLSAGEVLRLDRLASNEKVVGVRQPLGPSGHIAYLVSLDGLTILKRSAGLTTSLSPSTTDTVLAVYATNTLSVTGRSRSIAMMRRATATATAWVTSSNGARHLRFEYGLGGRRQTATRSPTRAIPTATDSRMAGRCWARTTSSRTAM